MSNIIDLSLLTQEPLVLKFSDEDTFTIPPEPKLEFVLKIQDFQSKVSNTKSDEEKFDFFVKMVVLILGQDNSKTVDSDFVTKNLSLSQLKKVVEIYTDKITENVNNPN
jgi:hypothetical protein